MEALASVDDVALGRELTQDEENRAERLLAQVSARFRRLAGQDFTLGESTVRRQVIDRVVWLPQAPVVSVRSVIDDTGNTYQWERVAPAGQEIRLQVGGEIALHNGAVIEPPWGSRPPTFVTVGYEHGYTEIPDDVRGAILGAVERALAVDADAASGVTQITDTRGPFSRTRQFASWATGGQALLSPDDVAVAQSYRLRPPRLWVLRP